MAISATFKSDFERFFADVQKASVAIKAFEVDAQKTDRALGKFGDSFSGTKIINEALNASKVIESLGGTSILTGRELQQAGNLAREASEKMRLLGADVPEHLTKIVKAAEPVAAKFSLSAKAADVLKSSFGQMTAAFGAGALIERGVSSLVGFGKEAFATAGRLDDLSGKTGIGVEGLQRMGFAAKQSGATLEQFTDSAFKLGTRLAGGDNGVKAAVDAIGLSFSDLRNATPEQQFESIVGALAKVENQQQRNRLGIELFGKSYASIASAVDSDYQKTVKGVTVATDAQVKALARAGDALDAFYDKAVARATQFLGNMVVVSNRVNAMNVQQLEFYSDMQRRDALLGTRVAKDLGLARTEDISFDGPKKATTDLQKALDDLGKSSHKASDAAAEALERQIDAFSGKELATEATRAVTAMGRVGGASKLTNDELRKLQATVDGVIDKFSRMGTSIPTSMITAAMQAQALLDASAQKVAANPGNWNLNGLGGGAVDFGALPALGSQQLEGMFSALPGVARNQGISAAITLGDELTNRLTATFVNMPSVISAAFINGGGASGAFKAIGVKIADDILGPLTAKLSKGVQSAIASGSAAAGALGGAIGGRGGAAVAGTAAGIGGAVLATTGLGAAASAGSVAAIVGLGAATLGVGAAAAGAYIGIKKLINIGKESRQTNNSRDNWIAQNFGTSDTLRKLAVDAGVADAELRQLFSTDKAKGFEAAANRVAEQINAQRAIVERYNLIWTDFSGPRQMEEFTKTLKAVQADEQALIRTGLSHDAALKKVSQGYIDIATQAVTAGQEIPAALAPSLLQLARMGQLTQAQATALLGLGDQAGVDFKKMEEAAGRYGIKLDELGGTYQQLKSDDTAKKLTDDFKLLVTDGGAPAREVLAGMESDVNTFLERSQKFGTDVPESMRPMLQKMFDMGFLTDDTGIKLTSLADLHFADPIASDIDRLIGKLDELIGRIGGVGTAFGDLPDRVSAAMPDISGLPEWVPAEGYATGTHGKYVDFGAGRTVRLHGRERVMTESEDRQVDSAALASELRGLRADMAADRQTLPIRLRSAVILARR